MKEISIDLQEIKWRIPFENKIGQKVNWKKAMQEMDVNELLSVLETTIKHDNTNKLLTLIGMLCAYTNCLVTADMFPL